MVSKNKMNTDERDILFKNDTMHVEHYISEKTLKNKSVYPGGVWSRKYSEINFDLEEVNGFYISRKGLECFEKDCHEQQDLTVYQTANFLRRRLWTALCTKHKIDI